MKVVADHADKVPGGALAIVRSDFPSFLGKFKHLSKLGRGSARSLLIERSHQDRGSEWLP